MHYCMHKFIMCKREKISQFFTVCQIHLKNSQELAFI